MPTSESSSGDGEDARDSNQPLHGRKKHKVNLRPSTFASSSFAEKCDKGRPLQRLYAFLDRNLPWVKENWTWSKIKPVIRCAVVAWVSAVLFVIPRVEQMLGQAGFLFLFCMNSIRKDASTLLPYPFLAALVSPPGDSFLFVLEREAIILLIVCLGCGWASLGIFLANLPRKVKNSAATITEVSRGDYVEALPTIILAIFMFFGACFLLYIKARQGPGPYLYATIFGCICVDIILTTAVLVPYPSYATVKSIVISFALHSAISLMGSVCIFPSTISTLFTSCLVDVLSPLLVSITIHEQLLATPLTSSEFADVLASMRSETKKSEIALAPLAAAARLIGDDLSYARFAPGDFKAFQQMSRLLAGRIDGLDVYWGLVDPQRERFPAVPGTVDRSNGYYATPVVSVPPTPRCHASRSRVQTPEPSLMENTDGDNLNSSHSPGLASTTHHPSSSIITPPHSPSLTRPSTRPSSIHRNSGCTDSYGRGHPHDHGHSHHSHAGLSHIFTHSPKHLSEILHSLTHHGSHQTSRPPSLSRKEKEHYSRKKYQEGVGTFESQKYLDLENTKLYDPDEERYLQISGGLLRECCTPVLQISHLGLTTISNWVTTVHSGRLSHLADSVILFVLPGYIAAKAREDRRKSKQEDIINELKKVRGEVARVLERFRVDTRHTVLGPYRAAFEDPSSAYDYDFHQDDEETAHRERDRKVPPHRYLFNCYVYQYHLIQMCTIIIDMLDRILKLEEERPWPHYQLWTPVVRLFRWNLQQVVLNVDDDGDDDPDVIQSHHATDQSGSECSIDASAAADHSRSFKTPAMYFPTPYPRDPDVLPPRNAFERISEAIYQLLLNLGSGNSVFALKAGIFTILMCLPSLLKTSSGFTYRHRYVWAIVMGQTTLSRFQGDTVFGLLTRIASTFAGGVIGLVMWYASCGSTRCEPYGFTAVCAVCFPFCFFVRLYWRTHVMTNMILFITVGLVISLSYQDKLFHVPNSPGHGFSVAWRRFVLVSIGVTAAFVVSFLPPSTTIRRYQRNLFATTTSKLGSIYCAVLSFANTKHEDGAECQTQEIISSLLAVRNKLGKSTAMRKFAGYEISFRGRWPANRYKTIADLQMSITSSLSHLLSIIEHLEPSWARAFLRRTRFMDTDFQGDILAVLSMVSLSLRTGTPLPQITPCPLLDRFILQYHGLNVIHKDAGEDYGLPRTLTLDTLRNEQYMIFCVGISTAFGLINRLDRLMVAVKEVVGEQYHIQGISFEHPHLNETLQPMPVRMSTVASSSTMRGQKKSGVELGERTNTIHSVHFHDAAEV